MDPARLHKIGKTDSRARVQAEEANPTVEGGGARMANPDRREKGSLPLHNLRMLVGAQRARTTTTQTHHKCRLLVVCQPVWGSYAPLAQRDAPCFAACTPGRLGIFQILALAADRGEAKRGKRIRPLCSDPFMAVCRVPRFQRALRVALSLAASGSSGWAMQPKICGIRAGVSARGPVPAIRC
jgi:hypothetical protein